MRKVLLTSSLAALLLVSLLSSAYADDAAPAASPAPAVPAASTPTATGGMDEIETLFTKEDETTSEQPATTSAAPNAGTPADAPKEASQVSKTRVKDVTDLGKLQPFQDIAVIQKRFLPKSQRFEFYIAPALVLNDAFFTDLGAQVRLGYYFSERYGVEGIYTYLSSSQRNVTSELESKNVHTESFVTPQGYYGLDFKWVPIYAKMTWQNKSITPFDFYFNFGAGLTPTNQNSSAATFHVGTGQAFAFSKSGALRWDFSWFMYNSTSAATGGQSSALYHTLMFSIGWSFFFPEASYR